MTHLIEQAGASFLRAFVASLIVLIPGLLAAPNVSQATAFAWGGSMAAIIAGLKAVQVYVPALTVGPYLTKLLGAKNKAWESAEDSFVRTFIGTFITLSFGIFSAPDLAEAKSLAIAAIMGAFTAAIRGVQGLATKGESPAPKKGLKPAAKPAHVR